MTLSPDRRPGTPRGRDRVQPKEQEDRWSDPRATRQSSDDWRDWGRTKSVSSKLVFLLAHGDTLRTSDDPLEPV